MNRLWLTTKTSIRKIFRLLVRFKTLFMRTSSHLGLLSLVLLIAGCASSFMQPDYDRMLGGFDSRMELVQTERFKHLLIWSNYPEDRHPEVDSELDEARPLVVFIEGDGVPWASRYQISPDPTVETPLLFEWFKTVDFDALYLGRPCYFDLNDPVCEAYWYTHGRYSDAVVQSMIAVLGEKTLLKRPLVLVGHSGGATLAALLAQRMNQVSALVTVAGNLDVGAWVKAHRYSQLRGSLDPSDQSPLDPAIKQIHYYSYGDAVIQGRWIEAYAAEQINAELQVRAAQGHSSAWHPYKEDIFARIRELIERP